MTEPHIRLQGVAKTYKTKNGVVEACSDINLDIAQSEFVAIVGPSGCGKTTILKMVAGLTPYTAGTIAIGLLGAGCEARRVGREGHGSAICGDLPGVTIEPVYPSVDRHVSRARRTDERDRHVGVGRAPAA